MPDASCAGGIDPLHRRQQQRPLEPFASAAEPGPSDSFSKARSAMIVTGEDGNDPRPKLSWCCPWLSAGDRP
jgi:hypothetical protein